ncbi:MAG: hypothetical protein ACRC41_16905 [Sarcina sp.]
MKLKDICVSIDKNDILEFMTHQDEVKVKSIEITDVFKIIGVYNFKKKEISFEGSLDIASIEGNTVNFELKDFSILSIGSKMLKTIVLKYIINSFEEIHGISYKNDIISVNANEIYNSFNVKGIKLDNFSIKYIKFNENHEIEVDIHDIYVDPKLDISIEEKSFAKA